MQTEKLIAFHGEPGIKEHYLARVLLHRQADELIQGTGWENGKGCAVGCTLEEYNHRRYPDELGIPLELAYLEDSIFEGLPRKDAMLWPERFLDAPKVGADLSDVWPQFAVWLLVDPKHGVIRFALDEWSRNAITAVANLWRDRVPLGDPRWRAARDEAWNSYAAAADAARYAAAAADAARYAAAARRKHWRACANKLIELMQAAPVVAAEA